MTHLPSDERRSRQYSSNLYKERSTNADWALSDIDIEIAYLKGCSDVREEDKAESFRLFRNSVNEYAKAAFEAGRSTVLRSIKGEDYEYDTFEDWRKEHEAQTQPTE